MRSDRIFARILLVFSVANVALAAPAAVRQRHLEVAKAALKRRGSSSGDGETSDLPPEPSSPMPSHDLPADKLKKWDWLLWPDSPKSSSAAEDRITAQASGASGSGIPPHDAPKNKWAWLYHGSSPDTTHASGASGSGNGATGDLAPESSLRMPNMPPQKSLPTNLYRPSSPESSSASENRLTTEVSGVTTPSSTGSAHMGYLPPPPPWPPHQGPAPVSPAASEAGGLFRLPSKKKVLLSLGVVTLLGGAAGYGYFAHQYLKKPNSRRDPQVPSSDVVGRGSGTHPRPPKKLVSRGLANLREEDLRLLSVLTRRAFESLP